MAEYPYAYTPREHLLYGSILAGSLLAIALVIPVLFVAVYKVSSLYGVYFYWTIHQLTRVN